MTARETMEKLLQAILHVKDQAAFERTVTAALEHGYQDVSDAAWRNALNTFASALEKGHHAGFRAGKLDAQSAFVDVTDIIMAAREMAAKPPRICPEASR